MSVGILLVTHGKVGETFIDVANKILGELPLSYKSVSVPWQVDIDGLKAVLRQELNKLNQGSGVLVLTDLYGATPTNVVKAWQQPGEVEVISGLNLPMLLKIMNYPHSNLSQLVEKAKNGGKDGVVTS